MPTFCPPVRLVGGKSENEGRVEIYYNNTWGTVCGDRHWNQLDSSTVCRQLGYTVAIQNHHSTFFGYLNTPVWMDGVGCNSHDLCLGRCSFSGFGNSRCQHTQDVFVTCKGIHNSHKLGKGYITNT